MTVGPPFMKAMTVHDVSTTSTTSRRRFMPFRRRVHDISATVHDVSTTVHDVSTTVHGIAPRSFLGGAPHTPRLRSGIASLLHGTLSRPLASGYIALRVTPRPPAKRRPDRANRSALRRPAPRTSAEALRRLVEGNRAFARMAAAGARGEAATMQLDPGDMGLGAAPGIAPAQRPFAAVLGCADARVPVEMVFQQRSNDVFVVRVAGNGLGLGGLGSFRFAAAQFTDSLRLVVVLGHSQCGAVTAAVDAFLHTANYLPLASDFPLRSLVDGILVSVRAASLAMERAHGRDVASRPGYRAALIETAVVLNAALTAFSLDRELAAPRCRVVFGRYDLGTGRLCLPSASVGGQGEGTLVAPPRGDEGFRLLASRVAASPDILALLAQRRQRSVVRRR
jgi:carbonic anhydrase